MNLETFYRNDGTSFRVRARVDASPYPSGLDMDIGCKVEVVSKSALRQFKGGETWGLGRFAPVTHVSLI